MNETKICRICNTNLPLSNFTVRKDNGKHRNECKKCASSKTLKWKKSVGYDKKQYEKHREKIIERRRIYRENNKEKVRLCSKLSRKKRKERDPLCRLEANLRRRSLLALRGHYKAETTFNLVGCSVAELRSHLESLFTEGMSWENYGINGWHIDHIKPCAAFDLTDPNQQKECFHYSNLQPMWAKDNLLKRDKY